MPHSVDVIFTGGGTAGHVTPNIALFPDLQNKGLRLAYIGQAHSIEQKLVSEAGLPFFTISAGKLRRYFDFKNFSDLFKIILAVFQSLVILLRLKPKLLFSKGGFVSTPVVWAAWLCRIPVIIHESDITPGLSNKLSLPFAKRICYSFPETAIHLPAAKALLTGVPIREQLKNGDAQKALLLCGFESNDKPCLLIMGGSQGSQAINRIIRDLLPRLLKDYNICHICGEGQISTQHQELKGYQQFSYVGAELADLLALATLVISRAGATSIFEFLYLQKPSLLIPLPLSASRGDQILNAASFEKQGFSKTIDEATITQNPELLLVHIRNCLQDIAKMHTAMSQAQSSQGKNRILSLIAEYF